MPITKGGSRKKSNAKSDKTERCYVDNDENRKLGRVGLPIGTKGETPGTSFKKLDKSQRFYVDNEDNRRLGRVGLQIGSKPVSKEKHPETPKVQKDHNQRFYVDNAENRRLGGVGLPIGSMPVSREERPETPKVKPENSQTYYVDNDENRRLRRVGLPVGSMPFSREERSKTPKVKPGKSQKFYVDNDENRRLGRVGLPIGSMPVSREELPVTPKIKPGSSQRYYIDNAENRRLGRVGLPIGSMPVSREERPATLKVKPGSSQRYYVDNDENRRLGRVGLPVGSMPVSSEERTETPKVKPGSSQRCYVDNDENRRLGRVGLPIGSMPVTREELPETPKIKPGSIQRYYVDNDENRRLGRVGLPIGSMPVSMEERTETPKVKPGSSQRCYVDNDENRRLGRVGLPVGSMPVSREERTETPKVKPGSSQKCYVDNDENRRLGRVGLPVGSMRLCKGDKAGKLLKPANDQNQQVYVDNEENRRLGRVGMPVGSIPVTTDKVKREPYKTEQLMEPLQNKDQSVYVDNEENRRLGRVGLPVGSMPVSKRSIADRRRNDPNPFLIQCKPPHGTPLHYDIDHSYGFVPSEDAVFRQRDSEDSEDLEIREYVLHDKFYAIPRPVHLTGKPKYAPYAGKQCMSKFSQQGKRVYQDTGLNRRLQRVGQPLGSKPSSKKSTVARRIPELIKTLERKNKLKESTCKEDDENSFDTTDDSETEEDKAAREKIRFIKNKLLAEESWRRLSVDSAEDVPELLRDFKGKKIDFRDLNMKEQIGRGGFAAVFLAKWKDVIVAVKKMRIDQESETRVDDMCREITNNCNLNHRNIVQFFGACVEKTDICIVMEYMSTTLNEALHYRNDYDFLDEDRLEIIRQICQGVLYLHSQKQMAHCDLKSSNILLNYTENKKCVAKISDFGLSVMRNKLLTSTSNSQEFVSDTGTLQYSAPEILRGDLLSPDGRMMGDIYALGLICFEILYEEEPFYDLNRAQLIQFVVEKKQCLVIPQDQPIDENVEAIMKKTWSFVPNKRPKIAEICMIFTNCETLYPDVPAPEQAEDSWTDATVLEHRSKNVTTAEHSEDSSLTFSFMLNNNNETTF